MVSKEIKVIRRRIAYNNILLGVNMILKSKRLKQHLENHNLMTCSIMKKITK
ncbi:hypothetical protein UT300012_24450 [Paraclostridium bifermentans]